MGNRYFVQYLLNVGALKADEVLELMAKASKAEPGLPLLAMRKGLLSSAQLSEMNISDEAAEVDLSAYADWTLAAKLSVNDRTAALDGTLLNLPAYAVAVLVPAQ